jgi:3-deoxy-manno-octulosonate cytidylyltransferase (CMP-KDO synthetase)
MAGASHIKKELKIVGIIPARYGSTRFPGKILAPIAGKTLIERTYHNARLSPLLQHLVVATDDQRIYDHVHSFGGEVVMTSPTCATGTDRLVEAVKKDPRFNDIDIIVNIQGDEPCVDPQVTQQVIEALINDPFAVMSTAVVQLTCLEEAHNPSIVKCVMDTSGNALYFSRALIPAGHTQTMQPHVNYYRHIGIYAYRRDFLLQYAELPRTPLQNAEDLEQLKILEHGFRIKTAVVNQTSIGVDTPEDIQKVEQWLCKQNSYL